MTIALRDESLRGEPALPGNREPADSGSVAGAANDAAPRLRVRRRRGFGILGAVLLACALGYLAYWWLVASRYVSTDDAYVDATPAQITPQVSASVIEVPVRNTQYVRAGETLVVLDSADARAAARSRRRSTLASTVASSRPSHSCLTSAIGYNRS